ncbi:MAG: hypothetical protein ACR2L6_09430 [Gemmatimonadaceae bacterium]
MNRHLLPDEFDLLVDEEIGFGVPELQAHVRECDRCRVELESARAVMAHVESLPHLAPSPVFAEEVMAQVNVFEPWHVAAGNTIRALMPRHRPVRIALGGAALTSCFTLTTMFVWIASRFDSALLLAGTAYDSAASAALGMLTALVGPRTVAALQAGGAPMVLTLASVMAVAAIISVISLRRASRLLSAQSRP